MAHGTEAWPAYVDGTHQTPDGRNAVSIDEIIHRASVAKRQMVSNQKLADFIVCAPYSTAYFAKK
jgi:hypothetical protein